jgi:hypothetical protein
VRELLGNFVGLFLRDEKFRSNLDSYVRFLDSRDGVFFRTMLQAMMSMMVEDMLSKRYTQLDAVSKDVEQRAYQQIYEVLLFFASPSKWIREKTAFKMSVVPSSQDRQTGKSKEKGR